MHSKVHYVTQDCFFHLIFTPKEGVSETPGLINSTQNPTQVWVCWCTKERDALIARPTPRAQEVILPLFQTYAKEVNLFRIYQHSADEMATPVLCYWDIRGVSTSITFLRSEKLIVLCYRATNLLGRCRTDYTLLLTIINIIFLK